MLLVPTVSLGSMVSCQLYIHATNNEGCSENKLQNHIISSKTQHRRLPIIFPLILQIIVIAQMMYTGREGDSQV